jgi:hypothetical protein
LHTLIGHTRKHRISHQVAHLTFLHAADGSIAFNRGGGHRDDFIADRL